MAFGNATKGFVRAHSGGGGGGGASNYNQLTNKPQINGVELTGNKSSSDLGIAGVILKELTPYDTDNMTFILPENYTIAIFVFNYRSDYATLVCPKTLLDNLAGNRSQMIYFDTTNGTRSNAIMKNGNIIQTVSTGSDKYQIAKVYYI